jgi:hypothetical protein
LKKPYVFFNLMCGGGKLKIEKRKCFEIQETEFIYSSTNCTVYVGIKGQKQRIETFCEECALHLPHSFTCNHFRRPKLLPCPRPLPNWPLFGTPTPPAPLMAGTKVGDLHRNGQAGMRMPQWP